MHIASFSFSNQQDWLQETSKGLEVGRVTQLKLLEGRKKVGRDEAIKNFHKTFHNSRISSSWSCALLKSATFYKNFEWVRRSGLSNLTKSVTQCPTPISPATVTNPATRTINEICTASSGQERSKVNWWRNRLETSVQNCIFRQVNFQAIVHCDESNLYYVQYIWIVDCYLVDFALAHLGSPRFWMCPVILFAKQKLVRITMSKAVANRPSSMPFHSACRHQRLPMSVGRLWIWELVAQSSKFLSKTSYIFPAIKCMIQSGSQQKTTCLSPVPNFVVAIRTFP